MTAAAGVLAAAAVVVAMRRLVVPMPVAPVGRRLLALSAEGRAAGVGFGGRIGAVGRGCPPWFADAAAAADLAPAAAWWRGTWGGVAVIGVGASVLGGPLLGLLGASGAVGGTVLALRTARHRHAQRVARSVPAALDGVARSCRAGASVVQAVRELDGTDVGPAAEVLVAVAAQVDRGVSLRAALDDLVTAQPVPAVRLAAAALLVGSDTGAAPARAVEGVAATIRDHLAIEREAAANATQARASAVVLVCAPMGFTVLVAAADSRVADFLFATPIGLLCLAAGLGLDVVGSLWMTRLVRGPR